MLTSIYRKGQTPQGLKSITGWIINWMAVVVFFNLQRFNIVSSRGVNNKDIQ